MITAYVWQFRGSKSAWGHAAVSVSQAEASNCYISWWPGQLRRPKYPKLAQSALTAPIFANIYSAPANKGQTFEDDRSGEDGQRPDYELQVLGLDAQKIKTWWDGFLAYPPEWSSLEVNCAMVAAFALRAGGADDVISGVGGWWRSWNTVWTPKDVVLLVEAINRGYLATHS